MSVKEILVVEDDVDIRGALQMVLEYEGYKVTTASHGQEALELLQNPKIKPQLIFLDLMMPVMNGWDFASAIARDSSLSNIPIVAVTAFSDKVEPIRAKAIIRKPVDLGQLLDAVKKYSLS